MSTTTLRQRSLWSLDSRVVVYAAIGAALYGVLGLYDTPLLGTSVDLRPAFALVVFFGYSFGPIVGLTVGLVGHSILEQVGGASLSAYWVLSVESGLVGLVAGLASLYAGRWMSGSLARKAMGGVIVAIVAVVIGFLFAFIAVVTDQAAVGSVLRDDYLPLMLGSGLVAVILVPVLVYAWDPLSESLAG
jgi:energy-coupling factor transport system substrate-specific component